MNVLPAKLQESSEMLVVGATFYIVIAWDLTLCSKHFVFCLTESLQHMICSAVLYAYAPLCLRLGGGIKQYCTPFMCLVCFMPVVQNGAFEGYG